VDQRAVVFGDGADVISRYVDILASRGIDWGLIGPREGDRLWERHVLNSVAGAALFPTGASVVDVGSGAGLPGIPLAVLRPDLRVTLLESLLRRANFLELAVEELGLGDRVTVVRARAEEHRATYDVVTSRAVAPLPRLVGWCLPLLAPGGRLLALKGSSAAGELADAAGLLRKKRLTGTVHEVPVPTTDETTWVIELTR
jgi:16S rRNA (guanine527-N7)-methyltransferase